MKKISSAEFRSIEDGEWYWIPRRVFEDYTSKIGVVGLALYNAYSSYARNKGVAFPSLRTLAEKLGVSTKTVIKYNRILEANGLIKIERRKGKKGGNLVTLLKVGDVKEGKLGGVSSSVRDVKEVQTKENKFKENKERKNKREAVNLVLDYFREIVGETFGFEPEIDPGKDSRLVRLRLKKYSLEELKSLIKWYLKSQVSDKLGISVSACLSAHVINLWKQSKSTSERLERMYPKWTRNKAFKN